LANLLGRKDSPIFGHHPLLLEESGKKLSKRFFSESVSSRRARGEDAKTILGEATWQLGFTATAKPIEVKDIGNLLKQFYRI
jgi:glutamyl/glutaminyl-tRNA synthetase